MWGKGVCVCKLFSDRVPEFQYGQAKFHHQTRRTSQRLKGTKGQKPGGAWNRTRKQVKSSAQGKGERAHGSISHSYKYSIRSSCYVLFTEHLHEIEVHFKCFSYYLNEILLSLSLNIKLCEFHSNIRHKPRFVFNNFQKNRAFLTPVRAQFYPEPLSGQKNIYTEAEKITFKFNLNLTLKFK